MIIPTFMTSLESDILKMLPENTMPCAPVYDSVLETGAHGVVFSGNIFRMSD